MTRTTKAVLGGVAAMTVSLCVIAWSHASLRAHRKEQLERDTQVVTVQFASRLELGLEKHRIALGQMAAYFQNSPVVTREEFYRFAAETLRLTPLCLRLLVVDSDLKVRWGYPPEHAQDVIGYDVRNHPEGYENMQRARASSSTSLSAPLRLVGGDPGFALTSPIFKNGAFSGAVVCSVRTSDFFAEVLLPEVLERYEPEIVDSGMTLFSTIETGIADRIQPGRAQFNVGGRTWTLRVRPRDAVARMQLDSGQTAFWTLGILLSLALGCGASLLTHRHSAVLTRLKTQDSALQETRQQLDGAIQQLLQAEKLSALGELVAGVAHEINNPLSAILGYTQLALATNPSPEVRKRLEIVMTESERAGKIVRNLLTFARKHPPEKKYLGLNGIIEKTLELKAYHFRVNQIQIELSLSQGLPMTMLDFHQIQQVVLNLLNNSEQSMTEVDKGGTIRISTRQVDEHIELRIEDSGPGIPEAILSRIFEPFFTTKKDGKGTGLGLSLCYGIVAEHGGTITAQSSPGNGATFLIRIPIVGMTESMFMTSSENRPRAASHESLRVFVIDDESNIQGFLVEALTARGYRVDTASDIDEALRKISANSYDLIISDMKMPHGTGKEIYRAVAAKDPRLARRIIFATGDGASTETVAFVKEAGNSVLSKPFRIEILEKAIAAALQS